MCTTSVVLCTYNGERYILQQLESLLNQTRTADEVLIFDDHSEDTTISIIRRFIKENKLDSWSLTVNPERLGWKKNFIRGICEAEGDFIFCCDQDDIWYQDKIEVMSCAMLSDPNILVLGGCAQMVDQYGKKIRHKILGKMKTSKNSNAILYQPFNESFSYSLQPGCAICFRKNVVLLLKKYWREELPHDQLIWIIGYTFDGAYLLDRNVIDWRRHQDSVYMGMSRFRSSQKRYGRFLSNWLVGNITRQLLYDNNSIQSRKYKLAIVNRYIHWIYLRENLIREKKFNNAFILLFRYLSMYKEKKVFLADLYDYIFYRN